jgi:hypothetical protein
MTIEPSTQDLPFLLVHGPLVWKAILALLVAAVLLLVWAVRRRAATREARAALTAIDRGGEAEGVVRGTLGVEGDGTIAATLEAVTHPGDHRAGAPAVRERLDWRADRAWIETAGGRVSLAGPIRVIAGTRAASARGRVPRATGDAHLGAARSGGAWVHRWRPPGRRHVVCARVVSVAAGDEVVVVGDRLERSPGSEATGYRSADVRVTLHAAEGRPLALAARRPKSVAMGLPLAAVVALAGVTAFIGWAVMSGAGKSWSSECLDLSLLAQQKSNPGETRVDLGAPIELSGDHVCALAAASPGQGDTPEDVLRMLSDHPYRDARALARLLAVGELAEGCAGSVKLLMQHERFEEAAAAAHRCGDARAEHLSLLALGRFREAAAVTVPASREGSALPSGATLIAAGRWREAARAVRARAEKRKRASTDPVFARYMPTLSEDDQCLVELLRHLAGDGGLPDCDRARWALSAPAQAPRRARPAQSAGDWFEWVMGVTDEVNELRSAEAIVARPDESLSRGATPLAWLAAQASLAEDASALRRASVLRWRAVGQLFDGNVTAAAATAQAAAGLADTLEWRPSVDDATLLPALVALYTPTTALEFDLHRYARDAVVSKETRELRARHFGGLLLRRGDELTPEFLTWVAEEDRAALRAAHQDGDARALTHSLSSFDGIPEAHVLALLPRIRRGREALVRQFIWAPRSRWHIIDALEEEAPWGMAAHAVTRRSVLRLAGANEEAARWDAIYRRFDQLFEDRRRLVALMLWSEQR